MDWYTGVHLVIRISIPNMRSGGFMTFGTKLKPRWDVHLIGDDDQPGYAGESLSSVLGE